MKNLAKLSEEKIKKIWAKSEIFLHYTGHMYGIGAAALNQQACRKINDLKQRDGKGFIILIPEISWLERYGLEYNHKFEKIIKQFWPANLTLILKDSQSKFSHLAMNGTVAVRIPDNPELREFIRTVDEPIVSTSINNSGESALTSLSKILKLKWFDFSFLPHTPEIAEGEPSTILNLSKENLEIIREGRFALSNFQEALAHPKIIFVCTANICRSPMGDYIARKIVEDENLPYRIGSAGFLEGGIKISQNSYKVLKEQGYDASQHISTSLTKELVDDCWLILTMTQEHKIRLKELDPNLGNKIFTLSEYTGYTLDIDDPYGLEISFYRKTFDAINTRVREMFDLIVNLENPKREGV